MARPAAYLGKLARAGGNAVAGTARGGGWQVLEMVRKYAHLASDHLVQYVDRMYGLRLVKDGEVATFSATATK
jgi:hypothetical protein